MRLPNHDIYLLTFHNLFISLHFSSFYTNEKLLFVKLFENNTFCVEIQTFWKIVETKSFSATDLVSNNAIVVAWMGFCDVKYDVKSETELDEYDVNIWCFVRLNCSRFLIKCFMKQMHSTMSFFFSIAFVIYNLQFISVNL